MNLYTVAEPSAPGDPPIERWLVWASTPRDAALMALALRGPDGLLQCDWERYFDITQVHLSILRHADHDPECPAIEQNLIVQRLAGWHFDEEMACEDCSLYPMGMPEYVVCEVCGLCRDCSFCCAECVEKENR